MKRIILSIIISIVILVPLFCLTLEGVGYGQTMAEARAEAAAEISKYLYSNVDAKTITSLADAGNGVQTSYFAGTEIKTQMPLLGVTYTDSLEWEVFVAKATIDSSVSLPMYYQTLDAKVDSIAMPDLTGVKSIDAARILNGVLADIEEYRKLTYAVAALGGVYWKKPAVTEGEVKAALAKVNGTIDSLEKAAMVLVQGCDFNGIYVEQPLPVTDNVASDFSAIFSGVISGTLGGKTTSSMQNARYYLSSRYSEDQDGNLFLTASLNDSVGNSRFSSSVTIPSTLLKGIGLYADGYDFRKSMATGETVKNGFNVYMRVNGGNIGTTFHEGDELFVEIKATQPCYFYIVGYVFNESGKEFSYLFPISYNEDGKDMFVGRIGSENVGKWIVINPVFDSEILPFEIMPPFGVETLQVYASTTGDYGEFLSRIPTWRETEDFYLISGNPEQVLSTTRALNVKKTSSAGKKADNSEASVTYRSIR